MTETAVRGLNSGRPLSSRAENDRYPVLQARMDRRQTARIAKPMQRTTGRPILRFAYSTDESRFSLTSDSGRIHI